MAADPTVQFGTGLCPLGVLLVARNARGLCAISLGDDPHALVRELQSVFPAAQRAENNTAFDRLLAEVARFIETPALGLRQPLDLQHGTAFQQRVWQALRELPAGTTVSYAQLARRLDMPKAARAIAQACAANRLAVAVPCHRVVRSDGGLAGYRWGVERKRALLQREA